MELSVLNQLQHWLEFMGVPEIYQVQMAALISFLLILISSWIVYVILNRVVIRNLIRIAEKTSTKWDNILFEKKVFSRLAHIVPAIIIYLGVSTSLEPFPKAVSFFETLTYLYMVITTVLVIDGLLNSMHEIYNTLSISKNRSIKGYMQVLKIFVYILGAGIIFSIILNKDLTTFFAGMGAMAAVLMLIFKDSILGLVAGVQLSANDMVRLGDWIQMDSRNADGSVIDISLITVKVQNWDKTISTIPTYALVSESFTNWRGMSESGGRRIKRSINIDMNSIHFLRSEEREQLKKVQLIKDYIISREKEVEQYNLETGADISMPVNGRRITNIGTFRKYIEEYLKRHPMINKDLTFLVRQLQPTEKGLPLEIYVFCSDKRWAYYESIQSDIFDHILSVIPHFGLRIFQEPSGDDITRLGETYNQVGKKEIVELQ